MSRRWLRSLGASGFVLACLLLGAWLAARNWDEVAAAIGQLEGHQLLASLAIAGLAMAAMLRSWMHTVRACGITLTPREGWTIFPVAQLTKYLPGGVWPILTQTALGRNVGVPAAAMSSAGAIHLALTVCAALVLGAIASPFLLPLQGWVAWAPVVGALLVLTLWPPVLNRLLALGTGLLRRAGLVVDLPSIAPRPLAASAGWCVLANGLFAVHLALLLPSTQGGVSVADLALPLVAYTLGSAAGVLLVLAPAGAGAREGVLVLVLTTQYALPVALVAAVLSRAVLIVVDVLFAVGQAPRLGPMLRRQQTR